jgi:PTH2 family peptidyl-tRNA hydrolase
MSHKEPSNIKQVIVMRTDTTPKMRKGKMVAQGAHASIAFLTLRVQEALQRGDVVPSPMGSSMSVWDFMDLDDDMIAWINGRFTKICLGVDSEEKLLDIYKEAEEARLEVHLITDSGQTEFGGQPTNTCLAIGPDKAEDIDRITGKEGKYPLKPL